MRQAAAALYLTLPEALATPEALEATLVEPCRRQQPACCPPAPAAVARRRRAIHPHY